jgi:hypothetical protein
MKKFFRQDRLISKSLSGSDVIGDFLELYMEWGVLQERLASDFAIESLRNHYSIKQSVRDWDKIVSDIDAYNNRLDYYFSVERHVPGNIDVERLQAIAEDRLTVIRLFRALVRDLTHTTEEDTERYDNLKYSIETLFDSINRLLSYIRTSIKDSTMIRTKERLGVDWVSELGLEEITVKEITP